MEKKWSGKKVSKNDHYKTTCFPPLLQRRKLFSPPFSSRVLDPLGCAIITYSQPIRNTFPTLTLALIPRLLLDGHWNGPCVAEKCKWFSLCYAYFQRGTLWSELLFLSPYSSDIDIAYSLLTPSHARFKEPRLEYFAAYSRGFLLLLTAGCVWDMSCTFLSPELYIKFPQISPFAT